jgi:hypothetical protein
VASKEGLNSMKLVSYVFVFDFVLLPSAKKTHEKHFHIENQKNSNISQKTHGKHFHIGQQK